ESARSAGNYAIVLASRPYHNDPLVNHDLPKMLSDMGHFVLPPDAVPGIADVDLSASRIDIVNNFHQRMLASAVIAADSPALEYVQLVSFGCGHDAYLSDEICRLMKERSGKQPLILKLDESDVAGPLRIRVRSFIETVDERRARQAAIERAGENATGTFTGSASACPSTPADAHPLPDPYPVKYAKADRRIKTILVPNTSHAFSLLMSAAFARQGAQAVSLAIGREQAIELGKRYVHNDICFPAQMTIGEALAALDSGKWDPHTVAIGTGKYIGDCRLTHYAALLRKALDDAGYGYVPIITNDDKDAHNMHPGFKMSLGSAIRIAFGLPMIDALEDLLRKMRPYELEPGAANKAFDQAIECVMTGMRKHGVRGAVNGFKQAIAIMGTVRYDRANRRPQVLIVGEYLLNFHPGANHDIEAYLESNGLEIIE
ncbi:MAG: acyl-CoA dehydratase activase-related protein, partial [Coriobacteriia bacterium]|nr:acyl-CoA dehydratase activase-related protein [Coriobacteriia bacterium]